MSAYFPDYPFPHTGKGLPSPADTPYETPTFIRSKRSSHATAVSSRDHSSSPPLDQSNEKLDVGNNDSTHSKMDARRFTPNLHASLVSEILSLRRELESKNNLVENLEVDLSHAKSECETSQAQVAQQANEVRKARLQVQQMEKETYDLVDGLAKDRDDAKSATEELRSKLDDAAKKTRAQDEDAARTQGIWETEKESWESERRQLERRVHVTEMRLRTVVEEMTNQQATVEAQSARLEAMAEQSEFKDSGLGHDSDCESILSGGSAMRSMRTPKKAQSSLVRTRASIASVRDSNSPQKIPTAGFNLADELGISGVDELDDDDDADAEDDEDEVTFPELRGMSLIDSRRGSISGDSDVKAKRVLGMFDNETPASPARHARTSSIKSLLGQATALSSILSRKSPTAEVSSPSSNQAETSALHVQRTATPDMNIRQGIPIPSTYVDTGYQPSPPTSPQQANKREAEPVMIPRISEPVPSAESSPITITDRQTKDGSLQGLSSSPISPPQTPVVGNDWVESSAVGKTTYMTASTQTEAQELSVLPSLAAKSDTLSPPGYVPSIAIHPPGSRPSSPRPYVLPPGTRNASSQANLVPNYTTSSMQTEEIRVDKRSMILSPELRAKLQPSPALTDIAAKPIASSSKRHTAGLNVARLLTKFSSPSVTPPIVSPLQSPTLSSPELVRDHSSKDLRSLRAIPLPRPVLSPVDSNGDGSDRSNDGPFNRSSQYGVTRPIRSSSLLATMDHESDGSEDGAQMSDAEALSQSAPSNLARPPFGRFGLSEPPKAVPEDKEPSPERRPKTADSHLAATAARCASSSFAALQAVKHRGLTKLNSYKHSRSRSPSFDSMISSNYSTQSMNHPPYPIPARSSSRARAKTRSDGARSPTKRRNHDAHAQGSRSDKKGKARARPNSLRKTQSANSIRQPGTPPKTLRRRQSPALTPVQSMAFDTPDPSTAHDLADLADLGSPVRDQFDSLDFGNAPTDVTSQPTNSNSISEEHVASETNLVDAIAATMVGEWMWKYVRKRKSFGIVDDSIDIPQEGQGAFTANSHGTRHRRWVWLSPYERTIMWDNKQPASGTALLGKKGRKYAIGSVLDVDDQTPLPKGSNEGAHTRSICILTTERALKFTTFTRKRHSIWMTALSFLAQSDRLPAPLPSVPSLPPMPPKITIPSHEPAAEKHSRSPAVGRSTIRDSVRLAKGQRPQFNRGSSQPDAPGLPAPAVHLPAELLGDQGAAAPAVPRLHSSSSHGKHSRKRSSTNPWAPQPLTGPRNHSASTAPSSAPSLFHLNPASTSGNVRTDNWTTSSKSAGSRRESLSVTGADQSNFFEAVGTVRMEAFVDPSYYDGVRYVPGPSVAPRRRRGNSNLSISTIDRRRGGYIFDEEANDPFNGF